MMEAAAYPCSRAVAARGLAATASTATAPAAALSLARNGCSKAELRLTRRPSSSFSSLSSSSLSSSSSCTRKKPARTRTVRCSAAGGGSADDRTTDAAASASSSGFSSSSPAADCAAAYVSEGSLPEQQRGLWGFLQRHKSLLGVLLLAGAGVAGFLWSSRPVPLPTAAVPPAAAFVATGAPSQASTGTEGADENLLLKTLRSDPKNEAALRSLLQSRLARGGAKEALDPLNKLIKLCPADLELQLLLGQAQVSMDDLAAARTTYQKVLKVDPYNTVALQGLTAIMQHENEGNAAVDLLREALQTAESDSHRSRQDRKEAIAGIKLVLVARGDVGGALQQYDDIIHSLPDDFRPHLSKGFVYTLAGDLQEAEECFTRSRQLCPEDYKSVVEQLIAVSAGESGDLPSEL
eukprot:jgi/Chlat1/3456/Chrsp23S03831